MTPALTFRDVAIGFLIALCLTLPPLVHAV